MIKREMASALNRVATIIAIVAACISLADCAAGQNLTTKRQVRNATSVERDDLIGFRTSRVSSPLEKAVSPQFTVLYELWANISAWSSPFDSTYEPATISYSLMVIHAGDYAVCFDGDYAYDSASTMFTLQHSTRMKQDLSCVDPFLIDLERVYLNMAADEGLNLTVVGEQHSLVTERRKHLQFPVRLPRYHVQGFLQRVDEEFEALKASIGDRLPEDSWRDSE